VWRWDQQEPFGSNPADQNPSGLGAFDLPLRLPGQTYDVETGLHYNYYRDFDPSLGRYAESDPIGLEAGLNTYSYVRGSPLIFRDIYGLEPGSLSQRGYLDPDDPASYGPPQAGVPAGWVLMYSCRDVSRCKNARPAQFAALYDEIKCFEIRVCPYSRSERTYWCLKPFVRMDRGAPAVR